MKNFFKKQSTPPPELETVELIRRNLLPYIQTSLSLQRCYSIKDLRNLTKQIEGTECRVRQFCPPTSNPGNLVEPEMAYHKPAHPIFASPLSTADNNPRDYSSSEAVTSAIDEPVVPRSADMIRGKWCTYLIEQVESSPQNYPLYMVESSRLYRHSKPRYPDLVHEVWLIVVPRDWRSQIIKEHHDPPTYGHLGVTKTYEDQRHWDAELQKVTCALRCAPHEATGLSPNFIVYGREIHLNGIRNAPHLVTSTGNNDSQQKSLALQKLFVDVKRRLISAYEKSTLQFTSSN
ncbi:hypothetical protein HHI36_022335 [Cryptolaemus montrouzieri]|uniref:Integrase zinc-binding domain-containing protein n=1 Tax=Cryptolaemus montrouzieri TaxID=559131 RepID=A0ABD2N090_9CUCU